MVSRYLPVLLVSAFVALTQEQGEASVAQNQGERHQSARCSLFGQYRTHTFDGSFYEFPGQCSYKLAGDCVKNSFSLLGNYQTGKRKSISLFLGDFFEVTLTVKGEASMGKKRVELPFTLFGVFVGTEAGYLIISSDEHGFTARIDTSGNVDIMLSKKHSSRTCGLCGNYNDLPQDDYTTQEGFQVESSYDFANSWSMGGAEEMCSRVSPPSKTCSLSSEAVENMGKCKMLKTDQIFRACNAVVDPEPFIASCEDDICHCEGKDCHCQAFLEYARSCAHQGTVLQDWTRESDCSLKCPARMEYRTCVPPCSKTCKSLNINHLCNNQCRDGCTCGGGKVLDGDTCVVSSDCSCMHMGKKYPAGSSISQGCHECVCSHGKWECTDEDCPGECFVIGQSHFKSFDDKYFTFAGMCQYLLAKDCEGDTFAVFIEKVQCADDPDAVCIRSATLRFLELENMNIKLKHGGRVAINGMDIQPPLIQGSLRIQHTVLSSVRVTYDDDFQFDWDGYGKVNLKLGSVYTGVTCGLCGNFNGNEGDDFLTPSGLVEPEMVNFGNSWKINGGCADLKQIHADPCKLNPQRVRYAEEVCSVLLLTEFVPCHHEVSPAPFLKICHYDVCACSSGNQCLCSAIASYAAMCARRGVLINWRSPDFCEMNCADGQLYEQCGTPCNQTCRSLSSLDTECTEFCLEGCYCPPGQYANEEGQCVPQSECSCYFNDEIYKPHEEITFENVICYCEDGVMHCSSNDVIHNYPPSIFSDAEVVGRVKRDTSCSPPMRRFDCPEDDPTAKGIECMKICQNYDFDCVSSRCTSGCMCPPGKVQVGTMCISPEMCSCRHKGMEYGPGETIQKDCNTCKCLNRKWQCTDKVCDGICLGVGEAHYITFDGLKYTFPGQCQYVLVQDSCGGNEGTFRILVEHSGCGLPGEECSKDITVLYDGGELELFAREVIIKKPFKNGEDMQIFNSGLYSIIVLGKAISILWDKGTRISVQIKGQYKGKVCGLCGNFDGNKNNDLLSSANKLEIDPFDFGNSWTVKHLCADAIQAPSPCSGNSLKQAMVENSCDLIKSSLFSECAKLIDPLPFWEICVYDTCSCDSMGECLCLCNAIAAYAHECAQRGIQVQWRTNSLCPMSCDELNDGHAEHVCEWRYNVCAPACPRTCQHPHQEDCPVACVEGCHAHCPTEKILDESSQTCVDPELCPVCVYEGRHISDGQAIVINNGTDHCQNCQCVGTFLHCADCPRLVPGPVPTLVPEAFPTQSEGATEVVGGCNRVMELVFVIDGSKSFSRAEFDDVKRFVLSMMEQMQIGQSNIRVALLQFHSRISKQFDLWEKKSARELKMLVRTMGYIGGSKSNLGEALKYTSVLVFGRDSRKNVPRVAILVTASAFSTVERKPLQLISKRKVAVITLGIGAAIDQKAVGLIAAKSPGGKSFFLKDVADLMESRKKILDYMCSRGASPPPPVPPVTTASTVPATAAQVLPTSMAGKETRRDVVFLLEASDKVGADNFNKTKEFVIKMIEQFQVTKEPTHVSVVQYADTVSEELVFTATQRIWEVIETIRGMHFHGGKLTNTGKALQHVIETTLANHNGAWEEAPDLVFMITSNPPTDNITNPFNTVKQQQVELIPILVGPDIDVDIFPPPIVHTTYQNITEITNIVYQQCCQPIPLTTATTRGETISNPTGLCAEPMDIIILLDGSDNVGKAKFEEMKSFVKSFMRKVNTGPEATHISILQYGSGNTLEVTFNRNQEKEGLLDVIDNIQQREPGPSRIGTALTFAVQNGITETNGARVGVPKVAVVIVTGRSVDDVVQASREAIISGVTVIPIGMGREYDKQELLSLAGPNPENVVELRDAEVLPMMLEHSNEFIEKVCTVISPQECIDDKGNRRQAGEKWMLPDKCHSFMCKHNGEVISINHKVNCEKLRKPTCSNDLPNIKIEETCGCRWACPCLCTVSAQTEIATFDGLEFSLTGKCSFMLLQIEDQDTQIIMHKGLCHVFSRANCIKAIEVKQHHTATLLHDNMTITVNGKPVHSPLTIGNMDIVGSSNFVASIPSLGLVLIFSPLSNLFGLWVSPALSLFNVAGLCGACDNNQLNDFKLQNGSVTESRLSFVNDWTLTDPFSMQCTEEVPVAHECVSTEDQCYVLLSSLFEACHKVVAPHPYLSICQKKACNSDDLCHSIAAYSFKCKLLGVCVRWRSDSLCPAHCPESFVYDACGVNCNQHCESIGRRNTTDCLGPPMEGCFCPEGKLLLGRKCVTEDVCTQCVDEQQVYHQYLDTWIPHRDPCQLCMCLGNNQINCTNQPCPAITVPMCEVCESPMLKRVADQCCPQYECLCDFQSCEMQPIPNCADGTSLSLKNPGRCRAIYECVCNRNMCKGRPLRCPQHRVLKTIATTCCDRYECVCSCNNEIVTCPAGYSLKSVINDCNCTSSHCEPNKVCVYNDVVYLVGRSWEESCNECSCTNRRDSITGLHAVQCAAKACNKNCPLGFSYREDKDACCGRCKKAVCEERVSQRGDGDPVNIIHLAGDQWTSSTNPCIMQECLEVNGEVVLHERNKSCSHIDVPKCPLGYELHCERFLNCCPLCQCVPGNVCLLNGSVIGVGESLKVDDCTECQCTVKQDKLTYALRCSTVRCTGCPEGFIRKKESGSCCGKCIATMCMIHLTNGTVLKLKADEKVQDNCDLYRCKVSETGDFVSEKRITVCMSFDEQECRNGGGEIVPVENSCCFTCKYKSEQCKKLTRVIKKITQDDCTTEGETDIHYCEGHCLSSHAYSLQMKEFEKECTCCAATASAPVFVPLRCSNGTVLQHRVIDMQECGCVAHRCE
ncbi:von Willebrand factor isoform X3 [Amblyraja radiata]|uniref:von Willebrand factor isoform X3 n=2 Tax=Amblyraja radiata TaxID=386614 RepID=UPI001402174F|nr:von Willebrand factor isoform X3 [Amblyraja radiata]